MTNWPKTPADFNALQQRLEDHWAKETVAERFTAMTKCWPLEQRCYALEYGWLLFLSSEQELSMRFRSQYA